MNTKALFFIFMSVLAGLNLGSIRKAEDPIRDTQTNPILYTQKQEEEKDGKKGPLLYHVKNSPRETFFIDPPFEKAKKSSSGGAVTGEAPASAGTADWWEEQPAASQTVPVKTTSEPLPEIEKDQDQKPSEPSAAAPEAKNTSSSQKNDYWW